MGEKKQIQIAVKDKIACLVDKGQFLVCGNNDYEVVFDFDSDWEGISAKTAVFVYGDTPIHQPFTGNICKGVEIKNATLCAIGVFAGNIKTTTGATIECRQSIRDLGGVPKPPTKEVYDEIMALLDKAIEAHTELPVGGKTGQILKKRSDEDYDTIWADEEKEDLSIFVKNEDFETANNALSEDIKDLDFRVSTLENLTLQYISDKSVSYKKDVPLNSGDHATLRSIGGMTYKCNNLTDAGTIQVNQWSHVDISLNAGTKYYISTYITSNDTDDTQSNTMAMHLDDGTYHYINFERGKRILKVYTPVKNVVRVTLFAGHNYPTSEGDTATWADIMITTENTDIYEPYFEGFRHSAVTELKAHGANLIPFPYFDGDSRTSYGVTWTVNADRSITVNGTATGNSIFILANRKNFTLPRGTYTLSGCSNGGSPNTYYNIISAYDGDTWKSESMDTGAGCKFNTSGLVYNGVHIVLAVRAGTVCNNLTFKPMLNYGDTALPYEPFKEAETIFQIPPEVQALHNYGNMFTELDLVNKKYYDYYVENEYYYSIDTVEKTTNSDGSYTYTCDFSTNAAGDIDIIGMIVTEKPYTSVSIKNNMSFVLTGSSSVDLTEADDNSIVNELFGRITFILKMIDDYYHYTQQQTIYDISDYIDNNIIKVTAGGAIEFVNEHKFAVPSEIVYVARKE